MRLPAAIHERLISLKARAQPLIDQLTDEFEDLPPERQQQLRVAAGVGAVALPLLIFVLPLLIGRISAHADRAEAQAQLTTMRGLERSVRELQLEEREEAKVSEGEKNTSLIAVLDGITQKVAVGAFVQSMQPVNANRKNEDDQQGEAVEMQLSGLALQEFLRLMYEIEVGSAQLTVRRLELNKDSKDAKTLRVNVEVAQ